MLRLTDIRKSFGQIEVLHGVSLHLSRGEVLGLVGENGAGKSTLMNVVGGVVTASNGSMLCDNEPYAPKSPRDAHERGIAFIHQELNLFPQLTVFENLLLHDLPMGDGWRCHFFSRRKALRRAEELLNLVGLKVDPKVPVKTLSHAQRQLVEIAKALSSDPEVIIFDEPTTSLSRHEAASLFALIQDLKRQDKGIIYISHNLEDVLSLSDRIMVLRDGHQVGDKATNHWSKAELVHALVGRELQDFFPNRSDDNRIGGALLKVNKLCSEDFREVSFSLNEGEVLGFYGLIGSGRSEMARGIYGLEDLYSGDILWQEKLFMPSPARWIAEGLVFLTEDRHEEGLLLSKNILQNIRLASLPRYRTPWSHSIDRRLADKEASAQAQSTKLVYQDLDHQEVQTLSGGNQQKVVLAKWLMTSPKVFILDEPTKGIDIGAKKEIYHLINDMVESSGSVILISSELEEIFGMCDRIAVMCEGQLVDIFKVEQVDRKTVMAAALPSSAFDKGTS